MTNDGQNALNKLLDTNSVKIKGLRFHPFWTRAKLATARLSDRMEIIIKAKNNSVEILMGETGGPLLLFKWKIISQN